MLVLGSKHWLVSAAQLQAGTAQLQAGVAQLQSSMAQLQALCLAHRLLSFVFVHILMSPTTFSVVAPGLNYDGLSCWDATD